MTGRKQERHGGGPIAWMARNAIAANLLMMILLQRLPYFPYPAFNKSFSTFDFNFFALSAVTVSPPLVLANFCKKSLPLGISSGPT